MHRIVVLLLVLLVGCAKMTDEKRAKLARENYTGGMSAYGAKEYGDAVRKLSEALKYLEHLSPEEIKTAKYTLAESYYLKKDYVNAVVYFEDFMFYYPDSPESEKVYFMLVDGYMKVAPDAYRDQSYTMKAIYKAKDFLSRYPSGPYTEKVKSLVEEAYKKLARHEYLIARFYEDFGYHYSAALRYRDLMINYPGYISEAEALYRYIKSLFLVEEQAKRQQFKYEKWMDEVNEKLKDVKSEEDRTILNNRLEFLKKEIERWKTLAEDSKKEGLKHMQTYREVYGENVYYTELKKYAKQP
ncbi:MAG: outer membrane protein assembly factor BamD [Aquificaceae bacterium]|nr:outer membrane protein assembly factor BamD [Aquificaceae bacterium]